MPPYARFKHPLEHERFRSLYVAWGQEKLVVPLQDLAFSTTLYLYICITVRAFCFCLQYYSKQFPHHQCQRNDITHGNEFTNKICTLFHHLSFNFANESAVLSKEMYGMVLLLLIRMGPCAFTNFRNIAKTHTHTIHFDYGFCKKSPKTSWPPWFVPLAPQVLVALIGCGSQHAVLVVLVVALALVALVAPVQHLGGAFNIFKSNHFNRGWKVF